MTSALFALEGFLPIQNRQTTKFEEFIHPADADDTPGQQEADQEATSS
jgi:hypothetical protein